MQTPPPPPPPSPMPSSSATAAAFEVDRAIWRAVAGATVRIPAVNSCVCYFPQGHLEQCSNSAAVKNYKFNVMHPLIPCQVISLRFLSDPASDQVYTKILLQPLQARPGRDDGIVGGGTDDNDDVVSYAKILTRSDANNGGGFSVPRFCAVMVLPELNHAADPPVQNLVMRDTHNHAWEFRHIYRGQPRRHLLTTGWSKYVNAKRLIAGDSVVFMRKKSTSELFVGLRRAERCGGEAGLDSAEAVSAIENAVRGRPFEVVYYPKVGSPDLVVAEEKVNQSMRIPWSAGMRVRMAVEADAESQTTWIEGVVTKAARPSAGLWCGSPWRMLQVAWDENDSSEIAKKVSPWEVEYIPLTPLMDPDFHPSKRLKLLQQTGMLPAGCRENIFSNPPPMAAAAGGRHLFNYNPHQPSFPAPASASAGNGMQGARQKQHQARDPTTTTTTNPTAASQNQLIPGGGVSTELSIASSYTDTDQQLVSPVRQGSGSVQSGGVDPSSYPSTSTSSSSSSCSSFQLFGKTIQTSSSCRCACTAKGGVCKCSSAH